MALSNQPGQAQPSPQQANMIARNAILASAKDMWLPIYTQLPAGTIAGQTINIPVRNVGLIKRFLVKITGTFVQAAAETYTLSKIGLANVLSNVQFTDLNNQQRINTSGWHLHYVATARRQAAFGAAFTNDQSAGIASNYPIMKVTSPLSTIQTFTMYYEIPISYGDYDLRGAIYANVVNATMNLQLTFNPSFQVATGANATLAVWQSSATAVGTLAITDFRVYQNFLDQLPMTQNGPVLPMLDLAHAYMLQNTALAGLVANQDNAVPFANFRQFLSTFVIFDNVGLNLGTDIGYLALQTANYTNIFKLDPYTAKVIYEREIINDDFPAGVHYFDTRRQPIVTTQQGNTQLIVNPLTVTSSASQFLVGFEMLALINQVTQAGSLPAA
jgi:hypothetical protein